MSSHRRQRDACALRIAAKMESVVGARVCDRLSDAECCRLLKFDLRKVCRDAARDKMRGRALVRSWASAGFGCMEGWLCGLGWGSIATDFPGVGLGRAKLSFPLTPQGARSRAIPPDASLTR
jgi:hypothetical protein